MQIHFILVRPVVPENVGFVCRALKNMGFDSLRIVDSDKHTKKGAQNTAYESHDILNNALVYQSLQEAVSDAELIVGTTARTRKLRYDYMEPKELKTYITERANLINSVAVVFGSESDGLSAEEEKFCDVLSTIPMKIDYPSVNLSHSVMIYAYELSQKLGTIETDISNNGEDNLFNAYKRQVDDFLHVLEVKSRQPGLHQQMRDKMMALKPENIKLFMSLARYLRNYLK